MNRHLIKDLDSKKPWQSLPGVVIIRNTGQVLENVAPIDNLGHVFLDETESDNIMAIVKLDDEFSPLEVSYQNFSELDPSAFQKKTATKRKNEATFKRNLLRRFSQRYSEKNKRRRRYRFTK